MPRGIIAVRSPIDADDRHLLEIYARSLPSAYGTVWECAYKGVLTGTNHSLASGQSASGCLLWEQERWENSCRGGATFRLCELAIDLAGQMAEGWSDGHGVQRVNPQLLQMFWQASELRRRPLAYRCKRWGRHQPRA